MCFICDSLVTSDREVHGYGSTIPILHGELGITVNELLCAEHLDEDYKKQADENIMDVFTVNYPDLSWRFEVGACNCPVV